MQCPRPVSALVVLLTGLLHYAAMAAESPQPPPRVYIGTYTGPQSRGIYTARFDPANGSLGSLELAAESRNPTFLALHPRLPVLYAAEEIGNLQGTHQGDITAFAIEENTGKLKLLNQQPSGGSGPCHLCVDQTGKWVLTANYNNGSIAEIPLEPDGRLGAISATVQHHGSSVNRERQAGPHAHFITTDPGNQFALVCDLGLDQVLTYTLVPSPDRALPLYAVDTVKPGSGPRHLSFSQNGRYVYIINELASTLTACAFGDHQEAGQHRLLREFQTVSLLPPVFKGQSTAAEVQVHPSGRFVYGSNRGHDSIAVFAVDSKTGQLTCVQHQSTRGRTPRHFTLDPAGRWLLAENQDSNNIVVFRVDPETGKLAPVGEPFAVPAPVCLVFAAPHP